MKREVPNAAFFQYPQLQGVWEVHTFYMHGTSLTTICGATKTKRKKLPQLHLWILETVDCGSSINMALTLRNSPSPEEESEEWSRSRDCDSGLRMDFISLESSKLESFLSTPLRSLASCSGEPAGGGRGLSHFRIPLGCSDSEKEARRESEKCLRMERGLSRGISREPPEPSRFKMPARRQDRLVRQANGMEMVCR